METIKDKPAVRLKPSSYQSSKAEMRKTSASIPRPRSPACRCVRREDRMRRKCLIGVVVTLVYKPRENDLSQVPAIHQGLRLT